MRIPVPKRVRSLGKKFIYGYLPGAAGAFPYFGSRVHFPRGAVVFDLICRNGSFEPEIVHTLTKLAKADTTIFDVGANLGLMAIPILQACPTCKVVSFEPSPNSLRYLQRTVADNIHRSRWSVVEKALCDSEGQLDFCLSETTNSMFDGLRGEPHNEEKKCVTVPVSTLDIEWRELGKPTVSVIKIDVEGAEGLVLKGASELLKAMTPDLVVEWYEDYLRRYDTPIEMILSLGAEYGYRLFTIPAGVPIDDLASLRVQMIRCSNFLLAKRTDLVALERNIQPE